MNDASLSASDHASTVNVSPPSHHGDAPPSPLTATPSIPTDSPEERKREYRDQKIKFLDHIIRNIDIMIYCELSILYYMECVRFSHPRHHKTSKLSPLSSTDQDLS